MEIIIALFIVLVASLFICFFKNRFKNTTDATEDAVLQVVRYSDDDISYLFLANNKIDELLKTGPEDFFMTIRVIRTRAKED